MKKALVVDDFDPIITIIESILAKRGYEVVKAYNGEVGLEQFEAHAKDICLIICDLNMPKMDGLTMLETLQKKGPVPPVIMLSASKEVDKKRAQKAGVNAWIKKPFTAAEVFLDTLDQVLKKG